MKQTYTVTVKQTHYLTYEVECAGWTEALESYYEGHLVSDRTEDCDPTEGVITIELKEDN